MQDDQDDKSIVSFISRAMSFRTAREDDDFQSVTDGLENFYVAMENEEDMLLGTSLLPPTEGSSSIEDPEQQREMEEMTEQSVGRECLDILLFGIGVFMASTALMYLLSLIDKLLSK